MSNLAGAAQPYSSSGTGACIIDSSQNYMWVDMRCVYVDILRNDELSYPEYESDGAAGADVRAHITEPIILAPLERRLVPTGIFAAIPTSYEIQIRPRSGLAYKHGITVLNAPGTIDSDYRGEIKVLLVNLSNENFTIENGDRIAQLVVAEHKKIQWRETDSLPETVRGQGGFSSTGLK